MTEDGGRAARYHDLFENGHEHKSDCAYCPICATIAVVRQTKPEVLEHLAAAARELIVAAGILLEEAGTIVGTPMATPSRRLREKENKVRRSTRLTQRAGASSRRRPSLGLAERASRVTSGHPTSRHRHRDAACRSQREPTAPAPAQGIS